MTGELTHGFAQSKGNRLHYVRAGSGEPMLLLHGAYGSGAGLLETPFGRAMVARFDVIAPDSLGHGDSDAPDLDWRYLARPRADDLATILDEARVKRAHVCGYSMGGWTASAFATHFPERFSSLTIGGWDIRDGMNTPARLWGYERIDFDILTSLVSQTQPDLIDNVPTERLAGLAHAINGMKDLFGLAEGVLACGVPTAIWMGRDDAYDAAPDPMPSKRT